MNAQSKIKDITDLIQNLKELVKPNPEAQKLRLQGKAYRMSRRQHNDQWKDCTKAEKRAKQLKRKLSKDEDGYTDEDKALIFELMSDINLKRAELIRAKIE